MYYVISVSEGYPESYWFEYDHESSPDFLSFQNGTYIEKIETTPTFRIKKNISKTKLHEFDFLMSDGGDFISEKFANLIKEICPSDVQLIESKVFLKNDFFGIYYIPNILNIIPCANMEKSSHKPLLRSKPDGPIKFTKAVFLDDSLGEHLIVRCQEDPETIVVSESFVQACKSNKILGVDFLKN